jgi:hypothetical protein
MRQYTERYQQYSVALACIVFVYTYAIHATFLLLALAGCRPIDNTPTKAPAPYAFPHRPYPRHPDLTRLVIELALCLPDKWYLTSVERDPVQSNDWTWGPGVHIRMRNDTVYDKVTVIVVPIDWKIADSGNEYKHQDRVEYLRKWNNRAILIWNNKLATWPTWRDDIGRALSIAESNTPIPDDENRVAVGLVQFDDVHININGPGHGFYRNGHVTDRRSGKEMPFSLYCFGPPTYYSLNDRQGDEVVAVKTNRMVAIQYRDLLSFRGWLHLDPLRFGMRRGNLFGTIRNKNLDPMELAPYILGDLRMPHPAFEMPRLPPGRVPPPSERPAPTARDGARAAFMAFLGLTVTWVEDTKDGPIKPAEYRISNPAARHALADAIEKRLRDVSNDTAKNLHDYADLALFLAPLGAREQALALLDDVPRLDCCYGPALAYAAAVTGRIDDLPRILAAAGKETEACQGIINDALEKLTDETMPLTPEGRTDRRAWEAWWSAHRPK